MGKAKKKVTLVSLIEDFRHRDTIEGFQFTAGNSPLGIKEERPMHMSCSLNFEYSRYNRAVIDVSSGDIEKLITKTIFEIDKYGVDLKKIRDFQKQFKKLGYEVEEANFGGIWYWFRVKCTAREILHHVEILKNNLVL